MDYCFCPPDDGLLYVELPEPMDVVTFLLQQRWRREPHLRTRHGYVPYNGGGVAFYFDALRMHGAVPTWYLDGDYKTALQQLVEKGIYDNIRDAEIHHNIYPEECEWVGPHRMSFSFDDIAFVWISSHAYGKDNPCLGL